MIGFYKRLPVFVRENLTPETYEVSVALQSNEKAYNGEIVWSNWNEEVAHEYKLITITYNNETVEVYEN